MSFNMHSVHLFSRTILLGLNFVWCVVASPYSLSSIEHVILFMQENRAFDHYYGTMAGVRGFADPNAQINPDGNSVFYQLVRPELL
jgi:phospholipase C